MEFHTIEPIYDKDSKILILGSFPSVKSREANFFYGHPQNRFWKVLANVMNDVCPGTTEEKKAFLMSELLLKLQGEVGVNPIILVERFIF